MFNLNNHLKKALSNKRLSFINGFSVLTDQVGYKKQNQVFPLHPEHQFYLDEIIGDKIKEARALEIGVGSTKAMTSSPT